MHRWVCSYRVGCTGVCVCVCVCSYRVGCTGGCVAIGWGAQVGV